jgi:hypothetical protein
MSSTPSLLLSPSIPTEIHLCIADFLPAHSLVALTLTCKRLLRIFGTYHHTSLRTTPTSLAAFLCLYERDLPEYYYLDHLLRRRIPGSTPTHNALAYPTRPAYVTEYDYTITFPHLLLALNRELHGAPHGLDMSAFVHSTTTTLVLQTDAANTYPLSVAIEPKIVADRFLLRTTYSISASPATTLRFASLSALDLRICRHSSTTERSSPWYDDSLAQSLGARKWTDEDGDEGDEDMNELFGIAEARTVYTGTCSFCMMDWRVEKEENGFVITTWMHLGGREEGNFAWSGWRAVVGKGRGREHECCVLAYRIGTVRDAFEFGEAKALLDVEELRA